MSQDKVRFGLFEGHEDALTLGDGEAVFRQGDPGDGRLFVVRSGTLAIRVEGATVETLGPGEMFGEMAIVDDGPRSATVVAEGEAVVVPVDRRKFRSLVETTPFFAENVMRVMAGRLRRANSVRA